MKPKLKLHLYKRYFTYRDDKENITIKYSDIARVHKYFNYVSIELRPNKKYPSLTFVHHIPNPDGLILYERLIQEVPWLQPKTSDEFTQIKATQLNLFS